MKVVRPDLRHGPLALGLSLALLAWAPTYTTAGSEPTPHDEHGDIALRMETAGGLAPLEAQLMNVPSFALYRNGLAVWRPEAALDEDARVSQPLHQARLTPTQFDALIELALKTGGLADARDRYDVHSIADASTTVFTVNAADVDRQVAVYALGFQDHGPDREAYERFETLAATLADFDGWLPQDTRVEPFQPTAYLAVFADEDPDRPGLIEWPWSDLATADLEPLAEAPFFSTAVLSPAQVEQVAPVPSGGAADIGISTPDGRAYRLTVRPLLPEEHSNPADGSVS